MPFPFCRGRLPMDCLPVEGVGVLFPFWRRCSGRVRPPAGCPLSFAGTVDLGLGLGGLVVVLLLLPHLHHQRVPIALVYLALGVVYALVDSHGHGVALGLHWPLRPLASEWDWGQLLQGFLVAGLPQLPLTTLNSIVAVVSLSDELFRRPCDAPHSPASPDPLAPPAPHPEERYAQPVEDLEAAPGPDGGAAADSLVRLPTLRSVAVSVGLLNLGSVWFGSMPMCHGCGGLASQYLFGARTQVRTRRVRLYPGCECTTHAAPTQ